MITKAFVDELISPTRVKVRIPIIDRIAESDLSIKSTNLNIATICSLPNCNLNLQVGDVVFVGFEDHSYQKPIILGQLVTTKESSTFPDLNVGKIVVESGFKIGEVTEKEVACLWGVSDNIQNQINLINDRLSRLETMLTEV